MGVFRSLRAYFSTKKKLREELKTALIANAKLRKRLNRRIDKAVLKLEMLEQNKVYFLYVDGQQNAIDEIQEEINLALADLPWTPPKILVANKKLQEGKNV